MARVKMLRLVKEGKPDKRLWHWTPELAKDPNMQVVYADGKGQVVEEREQEESRPVYWAKSSDEFGKFDIVRTVDGEDEIVDTITGKEAALARADELNNPEGGVPQSAVAQKKREKTPEELRTEAIEEVIAGLPDEAWSNGKIPYPKVAEVSEAVGFQVTFQEIKVIVQALRGAVKQEGEEE